MGRRDGGYDWAAECDLQVRQVHELVQRIGQAKAEIRGAMLRMIDEPGAMLALRRALVALEGGRLATDREGSGDEANF